MQIFGKSAARVNDSLSCGCKLLPKQNLVVQDNGGNLNQNSSKLKLSDNFINPTEEHGIKFQLQDQASGKPLVQQYFKLRDPDGNEIQGFTDKNGYTQLIKTGTEAKEVDLMTFDLSKPMEEWR